MSATTFQEIATRQRPPSQEAGLILSKRLWLLAAVLISLIPKVIYLPWWISTLCILFVLWNAQVIFRLGRGKNTSGVSVRWAEQIPVWPRWRLRLTLIMTLALLAVVVQYRHAVDRDAAISVVMLLATLKLMETHNLRDARAVVLLCYFLAFTTMLFDQSILQALWLILSLLATTGAAIALHHPLPRFTSHLRLAGGLLLQSVPLGLVLFILFPRITTPLWGVPQSQLSQSGLSDRMSAGSISQLVRSADIAFQVSFQGAVPKKSDLYWRGPVLSSLEDNTWVSGPPRLKKEPIFAASGTAWNYQVVLQPHNKPWLFALDYPLAAPQDALLGADFQMIAKQPVTSLLRYDLESRPLAPTEFRESSFILRENQQLPRQGNPRTRALAEKFRSQAANKSNADEAVLNSALAYFRNEKFSYTLSPPLMIKDPMDQFLFDFRAGFCEHFAGSFVFLLRAAGVSARVVTGYQGGEFNDFSQTLVVRQYDAHAWAEVWVNEHWQRVDPTGLVSPERVESGLGGSINDGLSAPVYLQTSVKWIRALRDHWQALNYRWDLWVLSYGQDQQKSLLQYLGFQNGDWKDLSLLLIALCASVFIITAFSLLWRDRPSVDSISKMWDRLSRRLGKKGLAREAWEGPLDYAKRVGRIREDLAAPLLAATAVYIRLRYSLDVVSTDLQQLRIEIEKIKP